MGRYMDICEYSEKQLCYKIERNGLFFYVKKGSNDSFWEAVQKNDWEKYTFGILSKYIDKNHTFVDVGSWIGPTLLYGAQLARMAHGIEPDPVALAELKENLKLNDKVINNVLIHSIVYPT